MKTWVLATLVVAALADFSPTTFLDSVSEGSGLADAPLISLSEQELDGPEERTKTISKRAADYYNGVIDSKFYSQFSVKRPVVPPNAVLGLGRPLQRGSSLPHTEYVILWSPRGGAPHWGTMSFGEKFVADATFVASNRIVNLTDPSMASAPTRLLQYVGTPESNNFKFSWVIARDVDPTTVVTQKQSGLCNPRIAPAVFQDSGYEFLGEADIDNRVMRYVFNGQIHLVDSAHFTNSVYLLTKQRCSCSCLR